MFNRAPLECKALIRAGFEYPGKLKKNFSVYIRMQIYKALADFSITITPHFWKF